MSAAMDQLIFDDGCGLCQRGVWLLRRFDWFKTITLVPLSNAADLLVEHSITTEAMMKAMHLVTRDGRVFAGAEAVREFGIRMPLLFPLALAMRLGFVLRLAKWVYKKDQREPICDQPSVETRGENMSIAPRQLKTLPRVIRVGTLRRA